MRVNLGMLALLLCVPASPQDAADRGCWTCSKKGQADWRYRPFDGTLLAPVPKEAQDYRQEITRGGLRIELVSFRVDRPKVKRTGFGTSEEKRLEEECAIVRLKLTNVTEVKKIDYTSPQDGDEWSLHDEFDNTYHSSMGSGMSRFDEIEGTDWKHRKQLNPEASIEEVLLFQVPVKRASKFVLAMNGSRWGSKGPIKIAFPKDLK